MNELHPATELQPTSQLPNEEGVSGPRTIVLPEFGTVEANALTPDEAQILDTRFRDYVEVRYDWRNGKYSLVAAHYVGVIQVGDLRIRIVPKTPAENLFYMFTYAWRLPIEWNELAELQEAEDIFEFIVTLFVQQIEELVHEGIFRAYRSLNDGFPFLRGRLDLAAQVRREVTSPRILAQELQEYTPDVLHNRILLWTLYKLERQRWRNPLLNQRIRRVERVFAEVSLTPVEDAEFDSILYSRLNETYESRHRLARLLLQMHSIEGGDGKHHFNGWLLDMDKLFELFVAHYLQEFVEQEPELRTRFRVDLQEKFELGVLRGEIAKPDIVVKEGREARLVLDTKNKVLDALPKNEDRRQMREYANILGLEDAWLIYSGGKAVRPSSEYSGQLPFTLNTLIWRLDGSLIEFRRRSGENARMLLKRYDLAGTTETE